MLVKELMTRNVWSCFAADSLDRAAQLMWEGDCGVVPVVNPDGTVVGMITDRDVCMAAYTRGRSLGDLAVRDARAKQVSSCTLETSLETAMSVMEAARVRRLPVVDGRGKLAGILSVSDLAREARTQGKAFGVAGLCRDLADTLGAVCAPHGAVATAAKPATARSGELVATGA